MINEAKYDHGVASKLAIKIQGLKMMYFFIKNERHISSVINKLINGAKKISDKSGFFIKVF